MTRTHHPEFCFRCARPGTWKLTLQARGYFLRTLFDAMVEHGWFGFGYDHNTGWFYIRVCPEHEPDGERLRGRVIEELVDIALGASPRAFPKADVPLDALLAEMDLEGS